MTATFLSAAELDAAPLGSFIPAMFGGRWVRVDGGWQYRMSWYDDEGAQHRLRGEVEPTLDAIWPHELRRASVFRISTSYCSVCERPEYFVNCAEHYGLGGPWASIPAAYGNIARHAAQHHSEVAA